MKQKTEKKNRSFCQTFPFSVLLFQINYFKCSFANTKSTIDDRCTLQRGTQP